MGGQPVASVMVLDTNNTPTMTGFDTFVDNGVTILAQGGLPTNFFGLPGKQMFIGTYSSGRYADTDTDAFTLISNFVQGLPLLKRTTGSWSLVYAAEQTLWTDPSNKARSWGLFGNIGLSDGNPNPIRWSGIAGFAGSSPIPGRTLDTFGAGYFFLALSDSIKSIAPNLLPLRNEQGVELFYSAAVTPWCRVTPDLQFVTPVKGNVDPVIAFGLRAKIDY
jgi:porin